MQLPEITFIVTYPCPRCHASLEARTSESHTWLRCPKCGRASLPPEHMRTPPGERPPLGDDVLVIGPGSDTDAPGSGDGSLSQGHPGSARRIALAVGLLLALFMLVVSFVEQNATNVFIFGVGTIVLFVILGMTSRRR